MAPRRQAAWWPESGKLFRPPLLTQELRSCSDLRRVKKMPRLPAEIRIRVKRRGGPTAARVREPRRAVCLSRSLGAKGDKVTVIDSPILPLRPASRDARLRRSVPSVRSSRQTSPCRSAGSPGAATPSASKPRRSAVPGRSGSRRIAAGSAPDAGADARPGSFGIELGRGVSCLVPPTTWRTFCAVATIT